MMKTKRIISLLLAVFMFLSSFVMVAAAAEDNAPKYTFKTSPTKAKISYFTDAKVNSAETKLKQMDLRLQAYGYRLYVDEYTGEVAVESVETGETIFTNPYDIASGKKLQPADKAKLLSQLVIKFANLSTGEDTNIYYSANKNLITQSSTSNVKGNDLNVSYIKDGIRVEYSIGTEESRMLLPIWIEKSRFEELCATMDENGFKKVSKNGAKEYLLAFYTARDPEKGNDAMYNNFPITKEGVFIYTLSTSSTKNKTKLEGYIKTYAPDYSYEQMDADHAEVKYEDTEIAPPLFKMALEYTLDENGVSVRLPANGIRYDETHYRITEIQVLPYMGAGTYTNEGYTFFPDGSGALFDFEENRTIGGALSVAGKIYGQDYAYHSIEGTNQQIIRYPVFGLAETQTFETTDPETKEVSTYTKDRGYVAIIEEGESLVKLNVKHESTNGKNTIIPIFTPKPADSYNLGDSVSIAANSSYTVASDSKYTGNYKVRYIMLTDADVADEKDLKGTYPCTYYGMAQAYREYLEKEEILTPLTSEMLSDSKNVPLYIEALGALETTEKILTIPVDVMTPLTTFKDINLMYNDLAVNGVTNINFILNGFTKGGLTAPQVPYKFSWEGAVEEGKVEFDELVEYARKQGFALYPDVDFVFIHSDGMFDGLNLHNHAAKTIDNRYASLQEYDATKQTYISYYELLFSTASMSRFYEKFTKNFNKKEDPQGISVSTLGSYLSSDFDEDDSYNRDDSETYTKLAFEYLEENYDKVMTSGGNAYSWKYVDYITDIATDSSRYSRSSASVPFLGIVLHGYVELSGTAINMEGNIDYAMLKSIENGSALKFVLAYRNTEKLKDDIILNKYYSIEYKIWASDIIKLYDEINYAIGDVQTSKIVKHEFIDNVVRVPDADELEKDAQDAVNAAIEAEKLANIAASEAERKALLELRKTIVNNYDLISSGEYATDLLADLEAVEAKYEELLKVYNEKKDALQKLVDDGVKITSNKYKTANTAVTKAADEINTLITEDLYTVVDKYIAMFRKFNYIKDNADDYKSKIEASSFGDYYKTELLANLEAIVAASDVYAGLEDELVGDVNDFCDEVKATIGDLFKAEAYEYVEPANDGEEGGSDNVIAFDRYAAEKNKVVYEEFENGKAFILNFNNYGVVVEYDDVSYTLGAYDYLVISKAK